jgi:hypothetical protein
MSALCFAIPLDIEWLMGSHEKHHGYLLYIGVISFILLLLSSRTEHLRSYLRWSMVSATIVALVAL